MASDLDKKLQAIIDRIVRDGGFTDSEAIMQIKEACNNARHSRDPRCVHWDEPGLCSCSMTKEDWERQAVKDGWRPTAVQERIKDCEARIIDQTYRQYGLISWGAYTKKKVLVAAKKAAGAE